MAVAKRQAREKPRKIEQREVRGPAGGPQVGQTALLAGPTYRAGPGQENHKKRSQRARLSLLFTPLGRHAPTPRGCIFLQFSK